MSEERAPYGDLPPLTKKQTAQALADGFKIVPAYSGWHDATHAWVRVTEIGDVMLGCVCHTDPYAAWQKLCAEDDSFREMDAPPDGTSLFRRFCQWMERAKERGR